MEAVGMYSFTATAEGELSFQKGDKLNILDLTGDWLKAEKNGTVGLIPATYVTLIDHEWFWGKLPRELAELVLESDGRKGSFLIRESESTPGDFCLSVYAEVDVQHFEVLRDGAGKYFLWIVKQDSLNELIKHHRGSSVSRIAKIYLKNSIKRKPIVRGLYDFNAQEKDELSFKKGDEIIVLDDKDSNWWKGCLNGKTGIFPVPYIKKIFY